MKNLWNNFEADKLDNDPLRLRVYTSRLLGKEEDLVLHGGGNTSVKTKEVNVFGEEEDIIYVKGSGWDLGTIEAEGFAPVKVDTLKKMAALDYLNDVDMVKYQRAAMTNPSAPNPSVEAILHAIIPYKFVDHTHADAVVTISNTPNGIERIQELYSDSILIVPYVMPGFILAKEIYDLTKNLDWGSIEGMILMNHGVFTFHDDPKASYDKMIEVVSLAEDYLKQHAGKSIDKNKGENVNPLDVAVIRKQVSNVWGIPILAQIDDSEESIGFSQLENVSMISNKGPLTPDHIIRTKRIPVILNNSDYKEDIFNYATGYQAYFEEYDTGSLSCLDPAPRWAIWPKKGILSFGKTLKNNLIIRDISKHTIRAIYNAEQLDGWQALPKRDLFEMEYWVLEQLKLKKGGSSKPLQGKIALVTGAASGIGKACVEKLVTEGAVVAALDINPSIKNAFSEKEVLTIECDVTNTDQLKKAIEKTVLQYGGLDMLITNAGIFPKSHSIENMDRETWNNSLNINLTSHQNLIQYCVPFLSKGIDPSIVIIGSKNVPAPGPGASAYSVAKAGLTQLGRIAALELGKQGIRVNILHPNAVYDTGIWNDEILNVRAKHYGLTVEEYKTNNVLKTEVNSHDVAKMAVTMLGSTFSKTTGAQVPIDGGNERII